MDHQGGIVLAATVAEGVSGMGAPNGMDAIRVASDACSPILIELDTDKNWTEARKEELNTTAALVRGVCACFARQGVGIHGFDLQLTSNLPVGGGMSSSAAVECLIGCMVNALFAQDRISPQDIARFGLEAEVNWFGKPCGILDQSAIMAGGISALDFSNRELPYIRPVRFSFEDHGYAVCLIDVGKSHSDATADFASIPDDMCAAARHFGKNVLGEVDETDFFGGFDQLRTDLGDRIALRALHFFRERELVKRRISALEAGDIDAYLAATRASGRSSSDYLQNISASPDSQPAMVALALADLILDGKGAFRIHGGGFGGSIQAYVPIGLIDSFCERMDRHMGTGACRLLQLGGQGAHILREHI